MLKPIKFNSKLINKTFVTETVLELKFTRPLGFDYIPGQFLNISVTEPYRRPYSITLADTETLSIIVEVRDPGMGADFFRAMNIGDETEILGPLGRFSIQSEDKEKIFISTGVGIAPFIPMIKQSVDLGINKISLYQGMRFYNDDLGSVYLKSLIETNKLNYNICVTREPIKKIQNIESYPNRVTETILSIKEKFMNAEVYVCGSSPMVKDTKLILQLIGVKDIFLENYG